MATFEREDTGFVSPRRPMIRPPKVRWTQILAISIFWFALNLHWSALGIIILPSQVFKIVGGPLIDAFTRSHQPVLGFQLLFAMAIVYCLIGTVTVRFIRGVKR